MHLVEVTSTAPSKKVIEHASETPARTCVLLRDHVEAVRANVSTNFDANRRAEMGQYMTPLPVALFMAEMIRTPVDEIHLLEPGAGGGSLIAAVVITLLERPQRPGLICVTAYESEDRLIEELHRTVVLCRDLCAEYRVRFEWTLIREDFIAHAVGLIGSGELRRMYNIVLTNPPYRKLKVSSQQSRLLRGIGIMVTNLYAGFIALAIRLAARNCEIIAITPRSFCNGPHFREFRKMLLEMTTIRNIHVFESRSSVFAEDSVLQENIIVRAICGAERESVEISCANGAPTSVSARRTVRYDQLVWHNDPEQFIRIVPDEREQQIADAMRALQTRLVDLGLEVSTGRVVDFRATKHLRKASEPNVAPLIYPGDITAGYVYWPSQEKKPNAIDINGDSKKSLLVPCAHYVVVKRFTAKEERRRVLAAVYDPDTLSGTQAEWVGFENHLNYYHRAGAGIPATLARGLMLYLNSTFVDRFSRHFSGHTQVNATDLRVLLYPTEAQLLELAAICGTDMPDQDELDSWIAKIVS